MRAQYGTSWLQVVESWAAIGLTKVFLVRSESLITSAQTWDNISSTQAWDSELEAEARDEGGMLRWLTPGRAHGLPGGECMG